MRLALSLAIPVVLAAAPVFAGPFGPLVSPAELSEQRDAVQPVLLDLRAEKPDQTWVPGSVSAPYTRFRGPDENPGATPPVAELEPFFEELGLEPGTPIVIIPEGKTDTDFGAAARVYWTLKSTGFTDLSILNGGEQAWRAAGFPTVTGPDALLPSDLALAWDATWTADTAAVTAIVAGESDAVLVDSRPEGYFTGRQAHEAAARPGTLPGAQSLAYTDFFAGGPTLNPTLDADALRARLGLDAGETAVAFCNTGHWAATEWFALSEVAGIENVKLYPGSMVEYSQTGAPMENTPNLLQNALRQIFGS